MEDETAKRIQEALKRAEAPKRPAGIEGTEPAYELEPKHADDAFERPERAEHTSEKEHPPGKE